MKGTFSFDWDIGKEGRKGVKAMKRELSAEIDRVREKGRDL